MNKLNFLCWLCDRICCFLEKFAPLWQKFYTAVGSDGSDKYHLFEIGSLLSLNNKQQRGSLLSLTTCWTNFNQKQREQKKQQAAGKLSVLFIIIFNQKSIICQWSGYREKKVCWLNARTVILLILLVFWHLFRKW